MKHFVFIVFGIVALLLAGLVILRRNTALDDTVAARPQVITPSPDGSANVGMDFASDSNTDTAMTSLFPLESNEILLQTLSIDFDGDGHDDQINAIRRVGRPVIVLVIGLYNPSRNAYIRTDEINTGISQTHTFSYTGLDITGEHRTALIFSGSVSANETIMQIFMGARERGRFSISKVGDFRSDGAIFVQQLDRYDSYETLQSSGTSFPVWVYSSDAQNPNSPDQLQTMYDWNPQAQRYMQTRQTRVTGQNLAATELARIQDGTVKTFASFLDGLWYRAAAASQDARYIFFDYDKREIIFMYSDIQEVYSWDTSVLRRNGIYISTVNRSIVNLSRRFDISLSGIDEFRARVQDDVRMLIGETTAWDGTYRKVSRRSGSVSRVSQNATSAVASNIVAALLSKENWLASDGSAVHFTPTGYSTQTDVGNFFLLRIDGETIIEFKSVTKTPYFRRTYRVVHDSKANSIVFEPVIISPMGFTTTGQQDILLQ